MPKFKEFVDNKYEIPMINKEVNRKLNPKTNRIKNFKKVRYHGTKIEPSDRTFKNLPKYANGKNKVRFQDWLLVKSEKSKPDHSVNSIGKSEADGKWYGWSHRAVYGFKTGDKITGETGAKKVEYPKSSNGETDWDNGKYEPDFTIKNDAHAKKVAIRFADSVS